jgi:hypothetical protein
MEITVPLHRLPSGDQSALDALMLMAYIEVKSRR